MLMEWKRKRLPGLRIKPWLLYRVCIFIFFSFFALSFSSFSPTLACRVLAKLNSSFAEIRYRLFGKADLHFQGLEERKNHYHYKEIVDMGRSWNVQRRFLGGPGSSPPRCASKCGKCTPCKPVHVPVPPGTPVTAEYYPEAWRCKCGNKLYMP